MKQNQVEQFARERTNGFLVSHALTANPTRHKSQRHERVVEQDNVVVLVEQIQALTHLRTKLVLAQVDLLDVILGLIPFVDNLPRRVALARFHVCVVDLVQLDRLAPFLLVHLECFKQVERVFVGKVVVAQVDVLESLVFPKHFSNEANVIPEVARTHVERLETICGLDVHADLFQIACVLPEGARTDVELVVVVRQRFKLINIAVTNYARTDIDAREAEATENRKNHIVQRILVDHPDVGDFLMGTKPMNEIHFILFSHLRTNNDAGVINITVLECRLGSPFVLAHVWSP